MKGGCRDGIHLVSEMVSLGRHEEHLCKQGIPRRATGRIICWCRLREKGVRISMLNRVKGVMHVQRVCTYRDIVLRRKVLCMTCMSQWKQDDLKRVCMYRWMDAGLNVVIVTNSFTH